MFCFFQLTKVKGEIYEIRFQIFSAFEVLCIKKTHETLNKSSKNCIYRLQVDTILFYSRNLMQDVYHFSWISLRNAFSLPWLGYRFRNSRKFYTTWQNECAQPAYSHALHLTLSSAVELLLLKIGIHENKCLKAQKRHIDNETDRGAGALGRLPKRGLNSPQWYGKNRALSGVLVTT